MPEFRSMDDSRDSSDIAVEGDPHSATHTKPKRMRWPWFAVPTALLLGLVAFGIDRRANGNSGSQPSPTPDVPRAQSGRIVYSEAFAERAEIVIEPVQVREVLPRRRRSRAAGGLGGAAVRRGEPRRARARPGYANRSGAHRRGQHRAAARGRPSGACPWAFRDARDRGTRGAARCGGPYDVALHRRADQAGFETAVEVRWAYSKALLARERLRTARLVEEFTRGTVQSARLRVEAGDLSPLRLRMAEAAFAQATQSRREAARAYRAACRDVATRAGWPADDPIEPVGELAPTLVVDDVEGLVAQAMDEHPELAALAKEIDAARAASRAARRDAWPEPTLGGYLAREREPGTPFASVVGLVTVSVPLPLWRRNQRERAHAEARVRIAEAALATRRYEIEQALRRSADTLSTAAERVRAHARDVLPRFEENLALLQRSFEVGEIDIVEVAVGRQSFLEAQAAALDTWAEYLDALRELELAVGRSV